MLLPVLNNPTIITMKGRFTLFLLLIYLHPFYSLAQESSPSVVNISGGSAVNGYYRFDWSVGELCIVETFNQPGFILENGFLHPGTERTVDSVNFFAKGDMLIFPNPVYTVAEINMTLPVPGTFNVNMFDVAGRLVMRKQFLYNGAGRIEKLDMQPFKAGTYFLYITLTPSDQGMPVRKGTYKITHLTL